MKIRLSSFPLVSGDTFALSSTYFPFGPWKSDRSRSPGHAVRRHNWFVEASDLESTENRDKLLQLASISASSDNLVIHNGDIVPADSYLVELTKYFHELFVVNVVSDLPKVRPIPIGLENYWRQGQQELFHYVHTSGSLEDVQQRAACRIRPIIASFKVSTNREVRAPLAQRLQRSPLTANQLVDRQTYRTQLSEALFVLSPPGNGPDCHRTWEAVYSGAIPVVLAGCLSESIARDAPILVVSDWAEVLDLSLSELRQLYLRCASRSLGSALMQHWLQALDSEA